MINKDLFVRTIVGMRSFINKMDEVDNAIGTNWTESAIGEFFDLFYDILIPDANEMIYDDFGEILFSDNTTEWDIEDFYDEYIESLK